MLVYYKMITELTDNNNISKEDAENVYSFTITGWGGIIQKNKQVDFSDDLIALMNHLNIENALICGLSMGAHISLQTAIRYPERVKGLILIGTPCSNTFNLYEKKFVPINLFLVSGYL